MTAMALGCSHTAGVGLEPAHCYVSVLADLLDIKIQNFGIPGGNAGDVVQTLAKQLEKSLPKFVIAQWPNPYRCTVWYNTQPVRENVNNSGASFRQLLKDSEQNFYQPWLQNIIVANVMCRLVRVTCVNIMIEDVEQCYHSVLNSHGIVLHVDKKLPGQTWLMDSMASDKIHHSAQCHKQWAQRIAGLLNEDSSP